jgi:hypothetical protein
MAFLRPHPIDFSWLNPGLQRVKILVSVDMAVMWRVATDKAPEEEQHSPFVCFCILYMTNPTSTPLIESFTMANLEISANVQSAR